MSEQVKRAVPVPTVETQYFWDQCREGVFNLERCTACGHPQFYPRGICSACYSSDVEWVQAQGRGEVISFTIVRRAFAPAFADKVPYVVALVRLEEGPQLMTHIVDGPPDQVAIGMEVEVDFEQIGDGIALPVFRPPTFQANR